LERTKAIFFISDKEQKNMDKKLRIGVIGVGQIGQAHLETWRTIPEVELVAIADTNRTHAQGVAERYGHPDIYLDFHELLARADIQAVDVCLHNNLHMPVSVAALEAGKHVYCEKPMAGSYRDAEIMFHTAQAKGLKLSIQLSTLFSMDTQAAKFLVDHGSLGKLYHARSVGFRRRGRPYVDGYGSQPFVQKRNSGGGALYDMGVYHIASLLYLLGNPRVLRVSGKTYQETGMDLPRRETSGYDVEELGLGFVKFADGITLDIIEAWAIHLGGLEGSSLLGDKGGIRLEPFAFYQSLGDLDLDTSIELDAFARRTRDLRGNISLGDSPQQHWAFALQGRVDLLPTAELALNTMLISEAIYLSDRLSREVTAEEVQQTSQSTAVSLECLNFLKS
jgi:predicted dehydrogenase